MKYYKTLNSAHAGPFTNFSWPLPENGQPGEFVPLIDGRLIQCERGYHFCELEDVLLWLDAHLYEFEPAGDVVKFNHKMVSRGGRLLRKVDGYTHEAELRLYRWCLSALLERYTSTVGWCDLTMELSSYIEDD